MASRGREGSRSHGRGSNPRHTPRPDYAEIILQPVFVTSRDLIDNIFDLLYLLGIRHHDILKIFIIYQEYSVVIRVPRRVEQFLLQMFRDAMAIMNVFDLRRITHNPCGLVAFRIPPERCRPQSGHNQCQSSHQQRGFAPPPPPQVQDEHFKKPQAPPKKSRPRPTSENCRRPPLPTRTNSYHNTGRNRHDRSPNLANYSRASMTQPQCHVDPMGSSSAEMVVAQQPCARQNGFCSGGAQQNDPLEEYGAVGGQRCCNTQESQRINQDCTQTNKTRELLRSKSPTHNQVKQQINYIPTNGHGSDIPTLTSVSCSEVSSATDIRAASTCSSQFEEDCPPLPATPVCRPAQNGRDTSPKRKQPEMNNPQLPKGPRRGHSVSRSAQNIQPASPCRNHIEEDYCPLPAAPVCHSAQSSRATSPKIKQLEKNNPQLPECAGRGHSVLRSAQHSRPASSCINQIEEVCPPLPSVSCSEVSSAVSSQPASSCTNQIEENYAPLPAAPSVNPQVCRPIQNSRPSSPCRNQTEEDCPPLPEAHPVRAPSCRSAQNSRAASPCKDTLVEDYPPLPGARPVRPPICRSAQSSLATPTCPDNFEDDFPPLPGASRKALPVSLPAQYSRAACPRAQFEKNFPALPAPEVRKESGRSRSAQPRSATARAQSSGGPPQTYTSRNSQSVDRRETSRQSAERSTPMRQSAEREASTRRNETPVVKLHVKTSTPEMAPCGCPETIFYHEGQHVGTETRHAEFKRGGVVHESYTFRQLVGKYICAFLNSEGGTIYFGVEDDGTVVGIRVPPSKEEDMKNDIHFAVRSLIHPPVCEEEYSINFARIRMRDSGEMSPHLKVLEVCVKPRAVPRGRQSRYTSAGTVYMRRDGSVSTLRRNQR